MQKKQEKVKQYRQELKNNTSGITLIALVVTIIVLIILAMISINLVIKDGGIISKAKQAKENTNQAVAREELEIMLGDYAIERMMSKKTFMEYFEAKKQEGHIDEVIDNRDGTYTVEIKGYEFVVKDSNLEIIDVSKIGGIRPKIETKLYQVDGGTYIPGQTYDAIIITAKITNRAELGSIDNMYLIDETGQSYQPEQNVIGDQEAHVSFKVNKNGIYTVKIEATTDNIQKIGSKSEQVVIQDMIAPSKPSLEIIEGTQGENGWYKSNVTVKITAGEELESGIEKTTYSITGVQTQIETEIESGKTVEITVDGISYISAYSYDKAGNRSEKTILEVKKDAEAPSDFTISSSQEGSHMVVYNQATHNGGSSITYKYYLDGKEIGSTNQTNYTQTIDLQYKTPYIPTGFSHTAGEVENGYVIKDNTNGNEFVWIPITNEENVVYVEAVDEAGNRKKSNQIQLGQTLKRREYYWGFPLAECTETDSTVTSFVTSANKYGGYYIGRYESGVGSTSGNATGVPVSKKGVSTWNNINWANAKASSEKMYEGRQDIQSALMNSYAWDTTCQWLENNGYNIRDGASWGNHSNNTVSGHGTVQTCGFSESWKANNIYDISGNVWEWTTEAYSNVHTHRGGSFYDRGVDGAMVCRTCDITNTGASGTNQSLGFRVILYQK